MKRRIEYSDELPRRLYAFFVSYGDGDGVPSFTKFARSVGAVTEDLESFRCHAEFERAYRECNEIRRDYLTDAALNKRYDPSFVKFLLSAEYGVGERKETADTELKVSIEVLADREKNEA